MKKIVALAGSALIITGCFLPILMIGEKGKSFFSDLSDMPNIPGMMDPKMIMYAGIGLAAIAVICLLASFISKTKFIWLGGWMGALTLAGVYLGYQMEMEKAKEKLSEMPEMMQVMAQAAFDQIALGGSGWYVIGSGVLLLVITPFFKK